jgi:superfamily II DNA or RNA helicase
MFQKQADETYCSSDHKDDPDCWRRDKGQPTAKPFINLFKANNVVVIREHTGLGKTHRALEFIKHLIRKVCVEQNRAARIMWIVHRRSLGADIKKRTAGLDIKEALVAPAVARELALLDFKYDIDFDTSTVKGKADIDECARIIIQVDSILKIKNRAPTWDLMAMDESKSIMRQW